ncbi:hypothetical protein M9H77_18399 [Catharanthus roseus]|uniref:Uncharacterized protein n=1 Tax=Catharanthus roseus TaxID=4058 RepID=A0ACC0B7D8_CATRO|nr:hypothetical protein M9H77_18399 [Catharanthus roseus]
MGKELSIDFEDTSLSLYLNPFLLYHEFCFKELKLFFELYASFVTLVGNVMVNPFTCDLAFDIDYMLKKLQWVSILSFLFQGTHVVLKVHPCDLVKITFENGVFELTLKDLDEKLVYRHALRFGEVQRLEYFKYILFKDYDANDDDNMKFEMERLVFDLADRIGVTLETTACHLIT